MSYFATLWSVQATLAALAYPMVIAFVAVFLQRRPAADSFMHVYLLSSGASVAGLSSLLLVVVMGIQYVAVPYAGAKVLLRLGALDSVWFLLNAVLTARFLYKTIDFLRPDVQLDTVQRYVASVALPREIRRLYVFQVLAHAFDRRWIPLPSYSADREATGPKVMLARFGFGRGVEQGAIVLKARSRLVNVRLWPLWYVISRWGRAAARWRNPDSRPVPRYVKGPLLTVPMSPGTEYEQRSTLALVDTGPDLTLGQQRILRWAFVFQRLSREKYAIRVGTIMSEFELDANSAATKADGQAFERAYDALVTLHEMLLSVSAVETEDGSTGSWAQLPDTSSFFDRALHTNWNSRYRSVFLAAVEALSVNVDPVLRVSYIVSHLSSDAVRKSPVEIRQAILDLPELLMYFLGNWWTEHIEKQGVLEHGPQRGVALHPPLHALYEKVLSGFIGAWESAKDRIASIPPADDRFGWTAVVSIARVRATHLEHTARMLITAVTRGDQTAAEWFADSLIKWWGNLQYENRAITLTGKTTFINIDTLEGDWRELVGSLNISIDDERRFGERTTELQRAVLLSSLENFWLDIQIVTIELLLSLVPRTADSNFDESLAIEIVAAMLTGRQLRPGDSAPSTLKTITGGELLVATVRQFAAGGHFRTGYVSTLSRFAERIKDMQQPGMVTSRTYSSSSIDDLDSLREQWLILMTLFSTSRWSAGTLLEQQLGVWMVRQYGSIEILQSQITAWIDLLNAPSDIETTITAVLLEKAGKGGDVAVARENLKVGLTAVRDTIEAMRGEQLRAAQVDPARLAELTTYASSTAFKAETGGFPLQLFRAITYSREPLTDFTLNMQQIRKGELTRIEMDRRAMNEEDYWAGTMRNRVAAVVLMDVLRACDISDRTTPDSETYWSTLKAESERMIERGLNPMLLLENQTMPDWVWHWQHADYGIGYHKPDDLRIWRKSEQCLGYICNFNEIEVYSSSMSPGASILMTRETFDTVRFQQYLSDAYVETTYSSREDSDFLLDVHLRFSRAVDIGFRSAIRLRYAPESGQEGDA
ncbi:hypothetical protein [Burkholderia anthina]|uniref:hypothetical protein n=1 Tax=Burkholderia anthina TaxID=179879 RepID=UPI00158E8FF2|nr:hypothetical protein [Burkholderia anthina]